jgi:Tol biopolymer transport system component
MAGTRVATWLAAALLAALAVPTGLASGQKNDEAEVLLQAARHKELVAGELEGAIGIYKKVLADHAGNRPVAARALVGLGQCYEKLGQQGAREAYERVLRDYADQSEAATEARSRLATLTRTGAPAASRELGTRRVWGGPGVDIEGSVSPDGRLLTFIDWETGDVAVRDLEKGENRRLTHVPGDDFKEFALDSRISPDGRQVVHNWCNSDGSYDLRLVGIDGSGSRVLYTDREMEYLIPAAWSPDGRHVLVSSFGKDLVNRIGLLSVAEGSMRVLKALGSRVPRGFSFSPDGRSVVYDAPPEEGVTNGDIFLLSIDGQRETPLVQHPANDVFPVWAPDGTWILFASDRTGSLGLWGLPVADGAPRGPAQPVKQDVGGRIAPLGFARDGRFYYGLQTGMTDVYTAPFDFQGGRLQAEPKRATERFVGSNTSPAWSPDGRCLAYVSHRGLAWMNSGVLVIRSLESGEERDLAPKLSFFIGPRWSPDGRSILLVGFDRQRRPGLFQVDVESGAATPLVQSGVSVFPATAQWVGGGKAIAYRREDPSTHGPSIVVRDLETGREDEIYRAPAGSSVHSFALSPDGQSVVFRSYDETTRVTALQVIPSTGGPPRELFRAAKGENIPGHTGLFWSPDGSQVFFTKGGAPGQDLTFGLWRVPAQGGEAQEVGLTMEFLRELRVHPDGQRIAFAAGQPSSPEVWVMENIPRPTAGPK